MAHVAVIVPCYTAALRPADARHAERVLSALGDDVEMVEGTCCGQPAYNAGFWTEARHAGREFLRAAQPFDATVMPSASCVATARHYLPDLFGRREPGARRIAERVFEFGAYVAQHPQRTQLKLALAGTVALHDSCHSRRELGLSAGLRSLLNSVQGLDVRELDHAEECCGFGGTFSAKLPEISVAMMTGKLDDARTTGARVLVSSDLSCLLHLQAGADGLHMNLETWSVAELLSRALG